jgi:hypothetical protein
VLCHLAQPCAQENVRTGILPHLRQVTLDSIISQTAKHLPHVLLMMFQVSPQADNILGPIKQRAQCFSLTSTCSISCLKKGGAFVNPNGTTVHSCKPSRHYEQFCNTLPRQLDSDGNPFSHQGSWKLLSSKVHQKYPPMSATDRHDPTV